jgi:hypothetical protein
MRGRAVSWRARCAARARGDSFREGWGVARCARACNPAAHCTYAAARGPRNAKASVSAACAAAAGHPCGVRARCAASCRMRPASSARAHFLGAAGAAAAGLAAAPSFGLTTPSFLTSSLNAAPTENAAYCAAARVTRREPVRVRARGAAQSAAPATGGQRCAKGACSCAWRARALEAGMASGAPVAGLRPVRAARSRRSKEPKLRARRGGRAARQQGPTDKGR